MFRRFMMAAGFGVLIGFLMGCAGPAKTVINKESIPYFTETKILSVTLMNGEVIRFDQNGGQYYEHYKNKARVIVGRTEPGKSIVIALDNVRKARLENQEEVDTNGVFIPALLIVGLVVAIRQ
ncbi:MAG: hypothetical protein ALAOOOJD_04445 [bacterium]|nr:hypothetical protein [bacterium]